MKRLCVSACLLGVPCRWKGDAKPCEAVQRLAERAVVRALDPATRSALGQSHAEFAESAEFGGRDGSTSRPLESGCAMDAPLPDERRERAAEPRDPADAGAAGRADARPPPPAKPRAEIVPFCPELAAGLGCPRPPIELVREAPGAPVRVLRVDRQGDATDALRAACEAQADALAHTGGVDGFILKARSPSCGLPSPLHDLSGHETGAAPGLWAALARERFPDADFRDET